MKKIDKIIEDTTKHAMEHVFEEKWKARQTYTTLHMFSMSAELVKLHIVLKNHAKMVYMSNPTRGIVITIDVLNTYGIRDYYDDVLDMEIDKLTKEITNINNMDKEKWEILDYRQWNAEVIVRNKKIIHFKQEIEAYHGDC